MALDPVTAGLDLGGKLIDRLWPNPADRDAARLKLLELQQNGELAGLVASKEVVVAEANSESWLAKSWRPILMLTFGGLIVARWFGWAAPNLTQEEYLTLWEIVRLGLSGYVIGRSAEKIVPAVADVIAQAKTK